MDTPISPADATATATLPETPTRRRRLRFGGFKLRGLKIQQLRHLRVRHLRPRPVQVQEWLSRRLFNFVHGRNLVYNTCWEDPRLDRVALELKPTDTVMVITSAGCNALDYVLCEPKQVHAVDMNPRQNALLQLKLAAIRTLDYERFFQLFGNGYLENYRTVYAREIRPALPAWCRGYWDKHTGYFAGRGWRKSFYFRGTSGTFARLINTYIDRVADVRDEVRAMLAAKSIQEQQEIWDRSLRDAIWTRFIRWAMRRDSTLSLLGVPRPQRLQVERHFAGGICEFIQNCLEAVFTKLPLHDNYFWRVYLDGKYSRDCCPEYLRPENFQRLQDGLVDRVSTHTMTIQQFLEQHEEPISRFILLDHMDWLSTFRYPELLQAEWQAIFNRATPGARVLFRSGGMEVDFVDPLQVQYQSQTARVGELVRYNQTLAAELHQKDRVHTYGSFYIADLPTS